MFRVRQDESQDRHVAGLPLGTVGGMLIDRTLPLDGEYQFRVTLFRTNLGTMRGLEYQHQLEISVDGERVHLASFGGDKEIAASSDNPTTTGDAVDGRFTARVPLKAGPQQIGDRVPREDARAEHAPPAELRAQLVGHDRLLGLPAHRRGDPHRAVQADRRGRHAEPPPDLRLPAQGRGGRGDAVRAPHPGDGRAARLSRRRHRRRLRRCCWTSSSRAAGRRQLRRRHRPGAAPGARQPEVHLPHRARPGGRRAGRCVSRSATRAGVAAVVLPLEQHSGRRAARRGARGR